MRIIRLLCLLGIRPMSSETPLTQGTAMKLLGVSPGGRGTKA